MANVKVWVNTGNNDVPLDDTSGEWTEFSEGNDQIIFTAGSDEVADGENTPTQSELFSAGLKRTTPPTDVLCETYLLLDTSANLLKQIFLMGDLDSQYVLGFESDGSTASEPVFEVWDNENFNSIDSVVLGGGTPSQSFIRGITTTTDPAGSPGWVGNRLAGSGSGNFLYLNDENGALTEATTLYAQIKLIVPSSQLTGFSLNPKFVVKWLS